MTDSRKLLLILGTIICLMALPYCGAYFYYHGVFPSNHFAFPPTSAPDKPGFNLTVFIVISILFAAVAIMYIFPRVFGFKKSILPQTAKPVRTKLPYWFWVGFIMWLVPFVILVGHFKQPQLLVNWADIPMFWGFSILLDGLVFYRTGGKSILGLYPKVLIGVGVASISGWMIFEYLNFFIDDNWAYPEGKLIPESEFTTYAFLGSSGLMPMAFEMHSLLKSFSGLRNRYSNGIKIAFPNWLKLFVLFACLASLWFVNYLPNDLFFVLWLSPVFMLCVVLSFAKVWTPLTSIKDGNWSSAMLFALAFYLQGMLHENWNYLSGTHINGVLTSANPDYWVYSLPYVNVLHWGEMPFLGLLGYLPFGVYCAVWYITFSFIIGSPTPNFSDETNINSN